MNNISEEIEAILNKMQEERNSFIKSIKSINLRFYLYIKAMLMQFLQLDYKKLKEKYLNKKKIL